MRPQTSKGKDDSTIFSNIRPGSAYKVNKSIANDNLGMSINGNTMKLADIIKGNGSFTAPNKQYFID